jgi:hypothetical protein
LLFFSFIIACSTPSIVGAGTGNSLSGSSTLSMLSV